MTNHSIKLVKSNRSADVSVTGRETRQRNDHWAVILAGGDGTRLRSMTRAIAGDDRPKQFCPIVGGRTLLDQTRDRVALSVATEKTLLLVTEKHLRFFQPLADTLPKDL